MGMAVESLNIFGIVAAGWYKVVGCFSKPFGFGTTLNALDCAATPLEKAINPHTTIIL